MRAIDFISPRRWRSFIIYLTRKWLNFIDGSEWTPEVWEVEQYMYRYLRCPACMDLGECTHCGCAIPERMHVRTDYCSAGRWGKFKTKGEWEKFKKDKKIKFVLYGDFQEV